MKKVIVRPTPFGPVVIVWDKFNGLPKVMRIFIPKPLSASERQASKLIPSLVSSSCREIGLIANNIKQRLRGTDILFSLDLLDFKQLSAFQEAVLRAVNQIPKGSISTYKLIARYLGKKNAIRAVGNALAKNSFPILIPCHRVICSNGQLGGFQGGTKMKRELLKKEKVVF